jgi:arylsulfatase A-like enzyme
VRNILAGYRTTPGLPPNVPSLATALKRQCYHTGLVGKWHLGHAEGSRSSNHGFDESFGLLGDAHDYFSHLAWPGQHLSDGKSPAAVRRGVRRRGAARQGSGGSGPGRRSAGP